jgi:hypothetical protein
MVLQSYRKLAPMELSSQRISRSISRAAAERVGLGGEDPAARVALCHVGVPGLAGLVRDRLGGLTHLVPRRGRVVRVQPGLLEERAVVVQSLVVGGDRDGPHAAVGVLARLGDGGVELVRVGQLRDEPADVGDLLTLDEGATVGERDREDVGQRAAGELGGERRAGPGELLGRHLDVRVRLLELQDALLERADRLRLQAGVDGDLDGHRPGGLGGGLFGRATGREGSRDGQNAHQGDRRALLC